MGAVPEVFADMNWYELLPCFGVGKSLPNIVQTF